MRTSFSCYHGHRFPAEIISHCVWLYFRFPLSFRDVEEMLAMRGISLSYQTVREWCLKFGSDLRQRTASQVTSTWRPMASRRSVPQNQRTFPCATRGRVCNCDAGVTMTSPDVLPSVSYRSMRERQLSGVKPRGQCIRALSRVATRARVEVATASFKAVGD